MWSEDILDDLISTPSAALVEDISKIDGDIMVLGAGGKMGPSLAVLIHRAIAQAGIDKKVFAVSRFTDPWVVAHLQKNNVEVISADLTEDGALERIPYAKNIIYMVGKKFGTLGNESETWEINASLPTLVSRKLTKRNFVVFSTGNIYPASKVTSGGCTEEQSPAPVGEYAMSSLARERIFERAANKYGSNVLIYRLNYAVDLRYGVLYDLADKVLKGEPISLRVPTFNCVWQGYANEVAVRALLCAASPANVLNVTGPETVSVAATAKALALHLGKAPIFEGEAADTALLSNAAKCFTLFGYPNVTLNTLIRWQAEWILNDGRALGKPTHFEERKGKY